MNRATILIVLLCLGGAGPALSAQGFALTPTYPSVTHNGESLPLAWFGGLNTPQTQVADLDGDGADDFLFFDKAGQLFLALRNTGSGYTVAPDLLAHFPTDVREWMMLRDYNHDSVPDLFHFTGQVDGITLRRGHRRPDGLLEFTTVDFGGPVPQLNYLFNGSPTSIFVSSIDYPAIADVDFDGDLDVLTFAVAGGQVDYYQNQAIERGFGADTLIFALADECWGGFFESGLTTALDLAPAPGACFEELYPGGGRPRHSGSSVLALDYDGNGLMDLMLGDISFRQLVLALNHGTREQAWISEQDTAWNDAGVVAQIPTFPAAFHLDVDGDGDRDIIGSPSVVLNGEDVDVMWLYRNEGSDAAPSFRFQTRRFLVDDMLDFGTSANVSVFDYDADGRPDLVVGNNDEYAPGNLLDSRLRLLRNVTPPAGPIAFALVDEDYLGLSAFAGTGWAFAPAFGDLDDDGDLDMVIGVNNGKVAYGENTAGAGRPASFAPLVFEWLGIDAGQFAKPFLSDLDRDGLTDLLVGGFDGRIRFYQNIGTPRQPVFDPSPTAPGNALQLGLINTNAPGISTGHPAPWVLQNAAETLIVTGNRSGNLELHRFGADSSYLNTFTRVTRAVGGLDVGAFANPAFGDFNGDGRLELVVGNERGGLNFFTTSLERDGTVGLPASRRPDFRFSVFPNPATDRLSVSGWPPSAVAEITLVDATGRRVRTVRLADRATGAVSWRLDGLPAGVYFLRLTGPGGSASRKVIIR